MDQIPNDNDPAQADSFMMFIVLTIVNIPRSMACPSWRLLLVYYTAIALIMAMFSNLLYVGLESALYFLVAQLLLGAILAICSFFYIPLDDSAQETQAHSVEREMASFQDLIGKFVCVAIAVWIFMWSLCDWRALPLFAFLSYKSLKLTAVYLLHLPSFWDSHAPDHHIPGRLPLPKLVV